MRVLELEASSPTLPLLPMLSCTEDATETVVGADRRALRRTARWVEGREPGSMGEVGLLLPPMLPLLVVFMLVLLERKPCGSTRPGAGWSWAARKAA